MAPALQYRTATQRPRVPAARAGGGHAGIADAPTPSEPDWVSTARRHAPLKFCPDHSMGAGHSAIVARASGVAREMMASILAVFIIRPTTAPIPCSTSLGM